MLEHPWAGLRQLEEHYSASLVKIAAMYAAYDLRASADQLAISNNLTTWPEIEGALSSEFDPEIRSHTPSLIANSALLNAPDKTRMPNYSALFQLGAGPDFSVDFTQSQLDAFEDMMVQPNNPGATTTIHRLGYPFLTGKVADDGFFDGAALGLWLAGDYAQQWPYVRIPCQNDIDTAQGTTARHLAILLTLLEDDKLVGSKSSSEMKLWMERAGKFFHMSDPSQPNLPPIWPPDGRFIATSGKVGIGPLKSQKLTFSEGLIVNDTARDLKFVVVWQNVVQDGQPQRLLFEPVAALVETAISAFTP